MLIVEVTSIIPFNYKHRKCHKKVGKYSMGMRQRLALAQAIMENQSIFILKIYNNYNLQHSAGFLCQHISHIIVFVTGMTFDFFKLYVYFGFDFVVIISVGYCAFLVGFPFSGTPF